MLGEHSVAVIGTRGYPSYYGGFETAVRKLAPYLSQNGWQVTVYGRKGSTAPEDKMREPSVKCINTVGLNSKSLSTLTFGLTATLHAAWRRPQVALVMNVANGYFLPILKARGIKTVVNVDGIEWDREKWGKFAKAVFRIGAKLTAKYADELVFDAKEIEKRWHTEFGRRGTYIAYGGDILGMTPPHPDIPSREYILVVARFVPENTIEEFFEAAEQLAKTYKVIIVGSTGYGGTLDQRAHALDEGNENITWLGHISDDPRLMNLWEHAGIYFHGHSVGGTNPTLVQAMALGAVVVARDTVYNREVLGERGIFCKPSASSIVIAVTDLMENRNLRIETSRYNKDRARTLYSWSDVNEQYRKLLLKTKRR